MRPAAVVLAAGASRRLGRCKAIEPLAGRPALAHLLDALRGAGEGPTLVVTGKHDAEIRACLPTDCEALWHAQWELGRSGSLAAAVRARPGRDLLVAPVDVPLVPRAVVLALLAEWRARGAPARGWLGPFVELRRTSEHGTSEQDALEQGAVEQGANRLRPDERSTGAGAADEECADPPRAGERRAAPARAFGHPILIGRELAARLLEWPPDAPLKHLRAEAEPLWALAVSALEILDDVDREADLRRLRERLGPA